MFSLLLIPLLAAMFLAINMGGSGTSPSFSAAYGSNIISRDSIPGLFGLFVFLGAILAGKKVMVTIGSGILPGEAIGLTLATIILLSVALSLLMANLLGIPQSTSQSTVFALIGPAAYLNSFQTHKLLLEIIPAWFILPVLAFVITSFIGRFAYASVRRAKIVEFEQIGNHPSLRIIVVAASCYVAFAIGSNNVANAVGPIASMLSNELNIGAGENTSAIIMILATLIVAPCFGIGSSIFGYKVVQTTGKEIVGFGPLGATLISVVTATLLLLASVTRGIPTSLVQMNTAAIVALGIHKVGWREILTRTSVRKLMTVWVVAPLISLFLSLAFTVAADKTGLL